jgi:outer membrane receptor protein involved in Fe transport
MAAARIDAVESFSAFVSPRLGTVVELVPDRLDLRASAGLSYRAPSFDELFWPPRGTAAGNPDLRAEHGHDADAGLALRGLPGDGLLSVDAFVRRVDDLIQWTPGAGGIWRPHNVGRVRILGVEAELGAELPSRLGFTPRLSGSATFLDARDRTGQPNVDGKELVYRPRWAGSAALILAHPLLGELETAWRTIDDVWITPSNTRALDGYLLGEVRWRRDVAAALALDLAVTNVTDASARDFRDFPLPGRSWKVGVTWQRRPE